MVTKVSFPSYSTDVDTLLFDLDETLLHCNRLLAEPPFMIRVFRKMKGGMPFLKFYYVLKKAVKTSKTHKTDKTNHTVFVEELAKHTDRSPQEIDELIQKHLNEEFEKMANFFKPVPHAKETILLAKELGYKVVIATNPSIPFCTVKSRLKWAGVEDIEFDFITHSEIMTRCKPNPEYYSELLSFLNIPPERCVMIGNDMEKDFAATKIGIITYILDTPWTHNKLKELLTGVKLEGHGSHKDLQNWLKKSAMEKQKIKDGD